MQRIDNHVYAPLFLPSVPIHYTRQQLSKLHQSFFHPSVDKLFNLIRRSKPDEADAETRRILEDITSRCDPCQRIQTGPKRFRVSFGSEDTVFNERVLIDIMYLDSDPVLHIVDESTHFSAARFLPTVSTTAIWSTLLECWALVYTGLPNRILVDQGSSFGDQFKAFGRILQVDVTSTGVEAHSSLRIGERYHQPLRTAFRKLSIAYPTLPRPLLLSMSVKAMNDTLGPEGIVPSALVFGEYPPLRSAGDSVVPRPDLATRASVASQARADMSKIMARLRIQRALRHNVPPAASVSYQPGDKVLVWRERLIAQRIGEWKGPYEVISVEDDKKLAHIQIQDGDPRPFNFSELKHYLSPSVTTSHFLQSVSQSLTPFRSPSSCHLHPFDVDQVGLCLLYTSPSPRDQRGSRMPSSA